MAFDNRRPVRPRRHQALRIVGSVPLVLAAAQAGAQPAEPPPQPQPTAQAAPPAATPDAPASPAGAAPPGSGPRTELAPVRVTGQRGSARIEVRAAESNLGALGDVPLLETPFSVNVVTRAQLDRQMAVTLGDVLKSEPAAAVGNVAVPFALLRGFSLGTDGNLYDGLPGHGGLTDGRVALQFIDRVDVLKGASAFLYGMGNATSLGGVLNYIPKRPAAVPVTDFGVGYTNRSLIDAEADVSRRFGLDGRFGWRVNLGWRDGTQAVERYGWNQKTAALAFDWRATPDVVLNLNAEYVANHIPELPPFYAVGPGLAIPKAPDASRNVAQPWDDFRTTAGTVSGRLDATLAPDWTLAVQALHGVNKRPRVKEARFGSIVAADGSVLLFGSEDASSETNDSAQASLHGRFATGALAHRLTVGLSARRTRGEGGSTSLPLANGGATNLYRPVDLPEPFGPAPDVQLTNRTRTHSVLVSDLVDFGPQWSALLGLRHARMRVTNYSPADGGGVDANPTTSVSKTLPTGALMWKPTPSSLVYLNHSQGLEAGGDADVVPTGRTLPPLLTRQMELGAKLDWRATSFTAALFDMKRPLEVFDADSGVNVQRGQQRHRGIELTAKGDPHPGLTVVGGLMWLHTRIRDTGDATSEGKQAPGVPRWNASAWAEYRLPFAPGVSVNGGAFLIGRQFLDGANAQPLGSTVRYDVGAAWDTRLAGTPATLRLAVENVDDKSYWASTQGGILTIADPRTVKLGLRLAF